MAKKENVAREEALRGGEENYKLFFQSMLDGLLVFDAETMRVVFANQAGAKLYGFDSAEEAIGVSPLDFVAPDDRERALRIIVEDMFQKDLRKVNEFRTIAKDGREIWISAVGTRTVYQGRLAGLISLRDITERKQMEEALRESEERIHLTVSNVPIVIWALDKEGIYTLSEGAGLEARGFKPGDIVGQTVEDVYRDVPQVVEDTYRALAGESFVSIQEVGKLIFESYYSPIRDKNQEVTGMVGVSIDITERKRAEEALQESEENFRRSLEDSPLGVRIFGAEGELLYANQAILDIYGYSFEELKATPIKKRYTPGSYAEYQKRQEKRKQGESVPDYEISIVRKNGEIRHLQVFRKEVLWNGKRQFQAIYQDITERKRMEHELREVQEKLIRSERLAAIGQLAGGVGHELRNPLGAIKNAAYYVKGKVARSELSQKEPRVMEFLDIMEDEINSSNKIINDLLGFSRVGKPSVSPTQIKNVIEAALSRTPIPENIKLAKKLDADLPEIEIDADQVQQVLANMISNAVEAMPEGGKLTIAARGKEECLEVEIADTGCGIPQEAVGKIFDPLFTTRAKGIGLGLALCKAIIDRHEGYIQVESQVGKGTTFTIKLPLKAK